MRAVSQQIHAACQCQPHGGRALAVSAPMQKLLLAALCFVVRQHYQQLNGKSSIRAAAAAAGSSKTVAKVIKKKKQQLQQAKLEVPEYHNGLMQALGISDLVAGPVIQAQLDSPTGSIGMRDTVYNAWSVLHTHCVHSGHANSSNEEPCLIPEQLREPLLLLLLESELLALEIANLSVFGPVVLQLLASGDKAQQEALATHVAGPVLQQWVPALLHKIKRWDNSSWLPQQKGPGPVPEMLRTSGELFKQAVVNRVAGMVILVVCSGK
eukprot:GHUV01034470.1.p1 GENE.GHUV01034470.1~~GHUV01034470.1.p1  ORF type:complete len:276 (-),score=112.19 GHUV01034470.1:333-1133(-)